MKIFKSKKLPSCHEQYHSTVQSVQMHKEKQKTETIQCRGIYLFVFQYINWGVGDLGCCLIYKETLPDSDRNYVRNGINWNYSQCVCSTDQRVTRNFISASRSRSFRITVIITHRCHIDLRDKLPWTRRAGMDQSGIHRHGIRDLNSKELLILASLSETNIVDISGTLATKLAKDGVRAVNYF